MNRGTNVANRGCPLCLLRVTPDRSLTLALLGLVVVVVGTPASAAASAALWRAELVGVAVADPHGLVAVLAADVVHVLAHLASEVVDVVVEAVPGGLAADADRVADGLPRRALGD